LNTNTAVVVTGFRVALTNTAEVLQESILTKSGALGLATTFHRSHKIGYICLAIQKAICTPHWITVSSKITAFVPSPTVFIFPIPIKYDNDIFVPVTKVNPNNIFFRIIIVVLFYFIRIEVF
jgi:hypothetical protein